MLSSSLDIHDKWGSIKGLALSQLDKMRYSGAYCHNDMDMLVVGIYGGSNNSWIAGERSGCTDTEYKTHFSLWCLMGSPLMMGCDVRNTNQITKDILLNRDLIAINQDEECRSAYVLRPHWFSSEDVFILVRALSNGELAVGFFNLSDELRDLSLQLWDIGLPYSSGLSLSLYDCWAHKELGVFKERYAALVPPHDCVITRAKLVK
jgi:alpha-galactosidase